MRETRLINLDLIKDGTLVALRGAGWYEGRCVDIANWVKMLTQEGFDIFPSATSIAEELNDLYLVPNREPGHKDDRGDVEFSLASVTGTIDRKLYSDFRSQIGEKTFPLGMVYGAFFFHIGQSNKIYLEGDGRVALLAENIESFLNLMVLGHGKIHLLFDNRKPK